MAEVLANAQAPAETPEERQARIEKLVARHEAPVIPRYLKPVAAAVETPVSAGNSGPKPSSDAPPPKQDGKQGKRGKGGKQQDDGSSLCINLVKGECKFGDKCRWNHDVQRYLTLREPDLPGTCPFTNAASCPYGIQCRWAGTHTCTDSLHEQLRQYQQSKAQTAQTDTTAIGTKGAETAKNDAETVTNGTGSSEAAPMQVDGDTLAAGASTVSDVPRGVVPNVPEASVQPAINTLSKDVQAALWRNRYDFTKADTIVKDLGLKVKLPAYRGPNDNKNDNKKGRNNKNSTVPANVAATAAAAAANGTDAAAAAAAAAANGAAHTDAEPAAAVAAGGDATGRVGVQDDVLAPELKRARVDSGPDAPSGAPAQPEVAAAAAAGAAAAAAAAAQRAEQIAGHTDIPLRPEEKRVIDFRGKTILAPLTTVGNLPFRRVCKQLGADVTVGEMALCTNLLQGQASEWALLKRHPCEDLFGVQIAGGFPDAVARTCQLIEESTDSVDYVDINMGCPIDIVCDRGAGSALLLKPRKIEEIARAGSRAMSLPLTLKTRKGYYDNQDITHGFVDQIRSWGPIALTLHGRTRQQRYSRAADWDYISRCADLAGPTGLQLIGNGDVFSYQDWNDHVGDGTGPLTSCMIGRGALIKPWLFTEIKDQRHWDISAGERLDLVRSFCSAGLQHWGSDTRGVDNTRRFLSEWLSYTHRYVPVGLLEVLPQKLHWRTPPIYGRSDLETLLSSDDSTDWIKISELFLGPVKTDFSFTPKHKSKSYAAPPSTGEGAKAAQGGPQEEDQAEG